VGITLIIPAFILEQARDSHNLLVMLILPILKEQYRSSGVQEFRSSGVQENPESWT
jgi:hypothetical protein